MRSSVASINIHLNVNGIGMQQIMNNICHERKIVFNYGTETIEGNTTEKILNLGLQKLLTE